MVETTQFCVDCHVTRSDTVRRDNFFNMDREYSTPALVDLSVKIGSWCSVLGKMEALMLENVFLQEGIHNRICCSH